MGTVYDRGGNIVRHTKNLGWLLRNWKRVEGFTIHTSRVDSHAVLIAKLQDGGAFRARFASLTVLIDWLHRPVFYCSTVTIDGVRGIVGHRSGYGLRQAESRAWRRRAGCTGDAEKAFQRQQARGTTPLAGDIQMTARPITDGERQLMTHVSMWGSDGYPIRKRGRGWHWDEAFGVKGPPTVYKTKRDAVAAFERFLDVLREALGAEAQARAIAAQPPAQDLKPGEPVEVRQIWAGGPNPIADWFGGYTFVEYRDYGRGRCAVLQVTSGALAGAHVNYALADVRRPEARP